MYIPALSPLLKNIGITKNEYDRRATVAVPKDFLEALLRIALASSDFNEEQYLIANPDIAKAVQNRTIESPRLHYVGVGYFEGREGGVPDVDERWYLRMYPDVAEAVSRRTTKSASQHFLDVGAAELRAPSETYLNDAVQWGKAFQKGGG